jgi:hypothetical protein
VVVVVTFMVVALGAMTLFLAAALVGVVALPVAPAAAVDLHLVALKTLSRLLLADRLFLLH